VSKRKPDLKEQMEEPWFKEKEKKLPSVYRQFGIEVRRAHDLMVEEEDFAGTWRHLERAHILSQSSAWRHLCVHFAMFVFAISRREFREAVGQLPRMILAAPSSLLGRAPRGNTGRANVGMFASLPVPKDLEQILESVVGVGANR
jgi:hypothetical protein